MLRHGRELDGAKYTAGITLINKFRLFDHDSNSKDILQSIYIHHCILAISVTVVL